MSKPKKILGKAFGGGCKTERKNDFCRYYRHKPYYNTILCEDCPDMNICAPLPKGSGDSSKSYYVKKLLKQITSPSQEKPPRQDWPKVIDTFDLSEEEPLEGEAST